jgi:hypothetical protein
VSEYVSGEFWLGLILGIPLAILANILTRPVQSRLDSRIRSRALRRVRDTQREYEEAKRYREHREEFYEFMLRSLVWMVTWTGSMILGLSTFLLVYLADLRHLSEELRLIVGSIVLLCVAVSAFMVRSWRSRALNTAYRVRNFPEYESRVKPIVDSESSDS